MPETAFSIVDIRQEVELPFTPERVFRALTNEIGRWWTSPFRQTGPDSRLELIPEIGAPMIEYGPGGHQAIWGRIEEIQPPAMLYLSGRFAHARRGRGPHPFRSTAERRERLSAFRDASGGGSDHRARARSLRRWLA